jgi:NhaP-type Na+/H+ or K+/H+ antiporter
MHQHAVLALAGIGLLGIASQWLAWWLKLPAILFLLLAGLAVGPVLGVLDPEALFGDLLFPLVSLSVAVILFEGSLTLRFDEIRGLERVVRNLVTVGLAVTWVVTAAMAHLMLGLGWDLSFLFGALVVVTGPTVIVPMLRTVRPTARVASVLRWEGIVIDPVGALLAVLVYEFIVSGQGEGALAHTLMVFARIVVLGAAIGALAGWLLGLVLRSHWLPEYLHNVTTLTAVFAVFALADAVEAESGLLAVTAMGLTLANMPRVPVGDILHFKESLSTLLISGLFIILAARVELAQLSALGLAGLGVLAAIQLVARPLKVLVSTLGSALTWRERALVAWIAPRGIVAAAVSSLFALRLAELGHAQAAVLVPLTFLVIIGTVVLQSATARPLAAWLGVAEVEPRGLLIVGANPLARAIGKALSDLGFRTLLADTNWDAVRAARMDGLATFFGNPVSEYADRHLDLVGIGRMAAITPRADLNALAALRYRRELGAKAVYAVQTGKDGDEAGKHRVSAEHGGQPLFGEGVTYARLASLVSQGSQVRVTNLTESFDWAAYQERYGGKAIPLFALTPRGALRVFALGAGLEPGAGWKVVALTPKEKKDDG